MALVHLPHHRLRENLLAILLQPFCSCWRSLEYGVSLLRDTPKQLQEERSEHSSHVLSGMAKTNISFTKSMFVQGILSPEVTSL